MLKLGIFGVGPVGKMHLECWKEIPGVELTGFYDPDDARARAVPDKYGVKRFTDAGKLMDKSDAVDITAPPPAHFDLCEKAIRKSKHVFVEKPLAYSMEEARQLVNLVQESNIKLQVGHGERFNPAFLAIKDIALNPVFVEVQRLVKLDPQGSDLSVIFDLMIDDIDLVLSIIPSDVKSISASGANVLTETTDFANVRIEFHNGCVANLTSSRISMKNIREMRIFQKDIYIGIDFLNNKTEIARALDTSPANGQGFDIHTPSGKRSIAIAHPKVPEMNVIKNELEAFKASIDNNTPTLVSERDGLVAMDIAHQVHSRIGHHVVAH